VRSPVSVSSNLNLRSMNPYSRLAARTIMGRGGQSEGSTALEQNCFSQSVAMEHEVSSGTSDQSFVL
jgi:hypothetical protein